VTTDHLVDQQARDTIATDLDRTLFVEAGAGTGKTHSLVQRIIGLLASGRAHAGSIAAMTFTEAAAAELRDRVRNSLEAVVADSTTDSTARDRCESALNELDGAAIETIHAFCRRLLAAYPLQAGLPPAFELMDETEAAGWFSEQWDGWFRGLLERAEENEALATPLLRVLALGASPDRLFGLASRLRDHWDRLSSAGADVAQPVLDLSGVIAQLDATCAHGSAALNADDRMAQHLVFLESLLRRLRLAGDDVSALQALVPVARNRQGAPWGAFSRFGSAGSWPKDYLVGLREDVAETHQLAMNVLDGVASAAASVLVAELARFVLEMAAERRRLGRLEFQDLLVLTRNLLAEQPEVRTALRDRYTHFFIDEFQDTDPLQAEIAFLLGSPPSTSADENWLNLPVDAGRLFFVGDPKQSIYRFRRADIDIYRKVRGQFEASLVQLTQNFRSVPAVIDWVNEQFAVRFGGPGSERQAPHGPLAAARSAIGEGVSVYRLGGGTTGNAAQVRASEAESVVQLLQEIRDGSWGVRGMDGVRQARLQDVAILSRTRTGFRSIVEQLEAAAIPHRVESRSLVFDAQEIRDLLAMLRAIDDPTDEVALLAALRAPAFACADDDLARYRLAGGTWDFRRTPPAETAGSPVVEALAWLRAKHEARWWAPLGELVDDVLRERRLFELALIDRRPRERWQRLRFVAEQARAHAERPEATLRSLIEWLQWQADEGAQVQERVVPESDDDAVRIMTVHASKGLEFPIVVLVGLSSAPRSQSRDLLWNDAGTPEVSLGVSLRTAGYEAALVTDDLLNGLERDRLLYVAMTRAEDHLILSTFHQQRGPKSQARASEAEQLMVFAEEHVSLSVPLELTPGEEAARPVERGASVVELEEAGTRETWREARQALISSQRRRHSISATTIAREFAALQRVAIDDVTGAGLEKDAPSDEAPPWRRGRAGTSIGRAVHSVLQTVDLGTGENLAAIAAAQATAEGVPHRVSEVERLARAALNSASVREAVGSDRYWREVYVATDVSGMIVDGFIDLLYETADGYVVVDYKTDSIAGRTVDDLLATYRPQALAYALVLGEQLERPVVRCEFVFVSAPGGAVVRTFEVTGAAIAELRESVVTQA